MAPNSFGSGGGVSQASFEVENPYPLDARPRAASPRQASADEEEFARWNLGGTGDPSYPASQASFHPGTRVVVDTRLAGRRVGSLTGAPRLLSSDRVQAQTRSQGYWPFRLCFEAGQREKKGLGGETRVAFSITIRGSVSAARLIASQLGNKASAACLVRELSKLRFSPRPAKHLEVLASIRLWPGDAELPPVADSAPATVGTNGAFDPDVVRGRIANRRTDLDACVADARRTDPALWGRLALSVILEVDGSVHQVREVESHFPNPAVARCAAAVLSSIVFPSVNGKPFSLVVALRLAPSANAEPDSSAPRAIEDAGTD